MLGRGPKRRGARNMKHRASRLAWVLALLALSACRFDGSGPGGVALDLRSVDVTPDLPAADFVGDLVPPHEAAPPPDLGSDLASLPPPDLPETDGVSNCSSCTFGCEGSSTICKLYDVSNVSPLLLRLGTADLIVPAGATLQIDTTGASATGPSGPWIPPPGAGLFTTSDDRYVVLYLRNLAVEGVLQVAGRRPLVLLVSQSVIIEGAIDVSSSGRSAGPGGGAGGTRGADGTAGLNAGCKGAYSGDAKNTWDATGAAGGSFLGKGGQGGDGPLGTAACAPSRLRPLVGGTGGGGGARYGGDGGGGGGALQVSAGLSITVAAGGVIHAGGGPGEGGHGSYDHSGPGSGGGGGSGGAILLEAPQVVVQGTLAANGGGGGGGAIRFLFVDLDDGDSGQPGQPSAVAATGGAGGKSVEGQAGNGGAGAAATTVDGSAGTFSRSRGGGGGGGAGSIHLRNTSGQVALGPSGIVSPAASSDALQPL